MDERRILDTLREIRTTALASYSNFHVAAILETEEGRHFTGINIESSSYGLTICAERVALFKALSEGERRFRRIYLLADGEKLCTPCGACRQVLMDYAPDIEVVMFLESGVAERLPLTELLPMAFGSRHLPGSRSDA